MPTQTLHTGRQRTSYGLFPSAVLTAFFVPLFIFAARDPISFAEMTGQLLLGITTRASVGICSALALVILGALAGRRQIAEVN